ncbi:hypothetical protein NFI96_007157 [Prochilodus magdalenae]|nr:hypothetical protein NFI96_007157 [Prochilodus magdalenae]
MFNGKSGIGIIEWIEEHFQSWGPARLQSCHWLRLRAANGLDIPYVGYLELDVVLCGKVIPQCGILVVKDPPGASSLAPGVLGMNIISRCYQELFGTHGSSLFNLPSVSQAPGPILDALQQCHSSAFQGSRDLSGIASVRGARAIRVPGGVMKWVASTCPEQFSGQVVLLEPPEGGLPAGLLVPLCLLPVVRGTVYVPVVNVGTTEIVLHPRVHLGSLCLAQVISLPSGVEEERFTTATMSSQAVASPVQLESLDLSMLSEQEQVEVRSLLQRYQTVFSAHESDLGCTNLISHDIPLLDEVPVRQRYRRVPPSEYEVVKAHINQLLEAQIIRESSSPYASPIVLVKKKDGSMRMCVDYRQLNSKTRKDAFPLPRIEESLDALSGACWFSTLDLASGYNQHIQRLEVVLDPLQREGLKAKWEKCAFFQKEVGYLGHVISAKGVSTDPAKVEAVAQWQRPQNVSELRSFLGFASYYRRFVEGFAQLAGPLHRLVAKLTGTKSKKGSGQSVGEAWTPECEHSFEALKEKLVSSPVLAYADFSRPFVLEVDASYNGLGAVLSQEQDGGLRPVAYASRGLRPTERNMTNYSSMKLEFLALKWAMTEKFREYLLGHRCIVFTDNNPLSYLQTAKLGAMEHRWAAQLAAFDFEIKYRSGRSNRNADALSRQYVLGSSRTPATQTLVSVFPGSSSVDLGQLQGVDSVLRHVWYFWREQRQPTPEERRQLSRPVLALLRQWDRLVEQDGVLFRQEHGHQGVERTSELVRERCYWPGMSSDVKQWCHEYFTVLEPAANGLENVLVITDVFSKYTVAVPTRDQRATTVGQVLLAEWFYKFGIPSRIHSDQVRSFENSVIQQGTGESPFFLMFGRDARLPVDFLLGRVSEPLFGDVHDWVSEHQARLKVAFDGAQERLLQAASRRKERHDQKVREAPLQAPTGEGAVYTIAPANNLQQGTMNSLQYQEILEENVMESVTNLRLGRRWTFQQDNDPKHTSKSTRAWLNMKGWNILEWPSQSPDLNPIENLWWDLKKAVAVRKPKNVTELEAFAHEEWAKIPIDVAQVLLSLSPQSWLAEGDSVNPS